MILQIVAQVRILGYGGDIGRNEMVCEVFIFRIAKRSEV
jgi:hypothetical protein